MNHYIIIKQDGTTLSIKASKHRSSNNTHYFATYEICDNIVYNVAAITYSEIPPTTEELLEKANSENDSRKLEIECLQNRLTQTITEYEELRRKVMNRERRLREILHNFSPLLGKLFTQKAAIQLLLNSIRSESVPSYACIDATKVKVCKEFDKLVPIPLEPKLGQLL